MSWKRMAPRNLAFLALVGGAIGIAFAPVLAKLAVNIDHSRDQTMLSPVAVAFWRMGFAVPFFLVGMLRHHSFREVKAVAAGNRLILLLPGFFFALDLSIWHWSFEYTSVANSTIEANFAVILVALAGFLWFKERFNWLFPFGAALALFGMIKLVGASLQSAGDAWIGDLLGLIVAFAYSGYQISTKVLVSRFPVNLAMTFTSVACAGFLALTALVSPGRFFPVTLNGWLLVVALALTSQVFGQGLIAFGMRTIPVGLTSVVLILQPLGAAILGWLVLDQSISLLQALSGMLVVAGIYLAKQGTIATA